MPKIKDREPDWSSVAGFIKNNGWRLKLHCKRGKDSKITKSQKSITLKDETIRRVGDVLIRSAMLKQQGVFSDLDVENFSEALEMLANLGLNLIKSEVFSSKLNDFLSFLDDFDTDFALFDMNLALKRIETELKKVEMGIIHPKNAQKTIKNCVKMYENEYGSKYAKQLKEHIKRLEVGQKVVLFKSTKGGRYN